MYTDKKWHIGYHTWEHTPTFRGFNSYLGYYNGGQDYYSHVSYDGGFDMQVCVLYCVHCVCTVCTVCTEREYVCV